MFNGIVEAKGYIKSAEVLPPTGIRYFIQTPNAGTPCKFQTALLPGSSVSVNGVCLTVTQCTKDAFWVDVSSETLSKTFFKDLNVGDPVNLERAAKFSDRIDGHIVTGHVDVTGEVLEIEPEGEFLKLKVRYPKPFSAHIVEKGSIAVDGISLTVNTCTEDQFEVMLIPETLRRTNLSSKKVGDSVHLEFDILAKYVQKFLEKRNGR